MKRVSWILWNILLTFITLITRGNGTKLVGFWGQNGGDSEQSLDKYCTSSAFHSIVIGYITDFFSPDNKDQLPELNLSVHCITPYMKTYPKLYKCPAVAEAIKICQQNNKQVQISLRGARGRSMMFSSQGETLAQTIWDMFLGGSGAPRPFGDVILDGVNLDITGGLEVGYPQFVGKLRLLMDADTSSRNYIITATPQCVFPYILLQQTFIEQGDKLDEIYVQFYDNYCHIGSSYFSKNVRKWFGLVNSIGHVSEEHSPKLFFGLIASNRHRHYQTPKNIEDINEKYKSQKHFGGYMLYDAGFDEQNVIDGTRYSGYVRKVLDPEYKLIVRKPAQVLKVTEEYYNNELKVDTTEATPITEKAVAPNVENVKEETPVVTTTTTTTTSTTTQAPKIIIPEEPTTTTTTTTTEEPTTTTTTTTEEPIPEFKTPEPWTTRSTTTTTRKPTKKKTTTTTTKRPRTTTLEPPDQKYTVAVNWGQNFASRSTDVVEGSLKSYCERRAYDIIVINHLDVFFDEQNQGDLPGIDFSIHCWGKFPGLYPTYLRCDEMAADIQGCQKAGKKILLALGGGVRWNGFSSADNAKLFAKNIWNLFLGGEYKVRTFGSVILDGINLDFRVGDGSWLSDFIQELRNLMDQDDMHSYMITASPACSFPNFRLGDTFAEQGENFDAFFVEFTDNRCFFKREKLFKDLLDKWLTLKPKILIGLPSAPQASYNYMHFVQPKDLPKLYTEYIQANKKIDGIFLDDTSWDDANKYDGRAYSDIVGEMLRPDVYRRKPPAVDNKKIEEFTVSVNWGQNEAGRSTGNEEDPLRNYCNRKAYDVIIINTLDVFFDTQNKDDLPGLDFGPHCKDTFSSEYPTYLKCDRIASDIEFCQKEDKKVILSLGAGIRWNGFYDIPKAEKFARTLWNLFLGGAHDLRTFGSTILDGINVDLRVGEGYWFNAFFKEMRELMNTDETRTYLITSTPECAPFPSWRLGKAFDQVGETIDTLYVNFADNNCFFNNEPAFKDYLENWLTLEPRIDIALPASPQASYNRQHYVNPKKFEKLFAEYIQKNKRIGGVLINDASWDDVNLINGKRYSDYIGELLRPSAYAQPTPPPPTAAIVYRPDPDSTKHHLGSWTLIGVMLVLTFLFNRYTIGELT